MFDISLQFLSQLISLIPGLLGIYVIFDLTGSLIFGRK